MNTGSISLALSGAALFGFATIGLFFLRFWQQTRERLFLCFAIAFFVLAIERVMLVSAPAEMVHQPQIYCTRLVAYIVIVWAIWDKNRPR